MQLTLPFCAIILAFTVGTVGQTPDGSIAITLPIVAIREGSQMISSRQTQNGTKVVNNNNKNCPSIVDRKKFRDNLVKKDKGKCKKKCPKNIKKYLAKLATCTTQRGVFRGTNLCPTETDTMAYRDALESKAVNKCDGACLGVISTYKSNAKTCKSFLKKKNKRDLAEREMQSREPRRGGGGGGRTGGFRSGGRYRGRDLEERDIDALEVAALGMED